MSGLACDADRITCTVGVCDGDAHCIETPDDSLCSHLNDPCNIGHCAAAVGCQYAPPSCDDGNLCTFDFCNAGCQHSLLLQSCLFETASTLLVGAGRSAAEDIVKWTW
ncbi:MAG: hypothetical protein ABI629_12715, partial [bacterium]